MELWRQLDIIPEQALASPVTVIGAGGIGSITTLLLAKMGIKNITVYDDDKIEDHNIPNQMYPLEYYTEPDWGFQTTIGQPKVEILKYIVENFTGTTITAINKKYTNEPVNGILISGVDSMKSRTEIFTAIRYQVPTQLYIDARMGAETLTIYTLKPYDIDDVASYEKTLYNDSDAIDEPCTAKAIIYNTAFIGSIICSRVKNYLVGVQNKFEVIADIPSLQIMS